MQLTEDAAVRPAVRLTAELIAYTFLDPDVANSRWRIGIVSSAGGHAKWFDFRLR